MSKNNKVGIVIYLDHQACINSDMLFFAGMKMKDVLLDHCPDHWDKQRSEINKYADDIGFIALVISKQLLLLARQNEYKNRFVELVETIKQYRYSIFIADHVLCNLISGSEIATSDNEDLLEVLFNHQNVNDKDAYKTATKSIFNELLRIKTAINSNFFLEILVPALFMCDKPELDKIFEDFHSAYDAINELFKRIDKEDKTYRNYIISLAKPMMKYKIIMSDEIVPSCNCIDELLSDNKTDLSSVFLSLTGFNLYFHMLIFNERYRFTHEEKAVFMKSSPEEREAFIFKKIEGNKRENNLFTWFIFYLLSNDTIKKEIIKSSLWEKSIQKPLNDSSYVNYYRYADEFFESYDSFVHNFANEAKNIIESMNAEGIHIVKYSTNHDVSVYFRDNVVSIKDDVVYKRCILDGQDFAEEFDELINAFQEYLSKVCGIKSSFEKNFTDDGVVYVINSNDKKLDKKNITKYLNEFEAFMCFCDQEVEEARNILIKQGFSDDKIDIYISMFQKKMRRILIDIKQESQRKTLALLQEFEIAAEEGYPIETVLNDVPRGLQGKCIVNYGKINFLLNSSATNIEGDYTYNKIDKELISYIEKLSKEKEELLECLSELKNSKTDQCQKQTALERLKKFLADHAEDIGAVALKILQAYLSTLA